MPPFKTQTHKRLNIHDLYHASTMCFVTKTHSFCDKQGKRTLKMYVNTNPNVEHQSRSLQISHYLQHRV